MVDSRGIGATSSCGVGIAVFVLVSLTSVVAARAQVPRPEAGADVRSSDGVVVLARDAVTASAREGAYHATITGCVVDPDAYPTEGAVVELRAKERGIAWTVASVTTDATGSFRFDEVDVPVSVGLRIDPGLSLRPRDIAIDAATNRVTDLGDVVFVRRSIVGGSVRFDEDGEPSSMRCRVSLKPLLDDGTPAPPTRSRRTVSKSVVVGDTFVLPDVGEGPYAVELRWSGEGGMRTYTTDRMLAPGERVFVAITLDRESLARQPAENDPRTNEWLGAARLEWRSLGADEVEQLLSGASRTVQGTVVDARGRPIEGVQVSAMSETATDADGAFTVQASMHDRAEIVLRWLGSERKLCHAEDGVKQPGQWGTAADFDEPVRYVFERTRELRRTVSGVPSSSVAWSWRHEDRWYPIPSTDAPIQAPPTSEWLRVEAPGHVPRILRMLKERGDDRSGARTEDPPALEIDVDWSISRTTRVQVRDARSGAPVEATIGLDAVFHASTSLEAFASHDLTRFCRFALVTQDTDRDGRASFRTDPAMHVAGFVYADGYEPQRFVVTEGEVVVDLVARAHRVRFERVASNAWVQVVPHGEEDPSLVLYGSAGSTVEARLAPGRYDVTMRRLDNGGVVGSLMLDLTDDEPSSGGAPSESGDAVVRTVDCRRDERPSIRLRLPENARGIGDTWCRVTRGASSGRVYDAVAISSMGFVRYEMPMPPAEISEFIVPEDGAPYFDIVVARPGRHTVSFSAYELDFRLECTIELAAAENREVVIPPLVATLTGSGRSYEGAYSHHGIAGPRLRMIADRSKPAGSQWDVVVGIPDASFTLHRLPEGRYHLVQHLAAHEVTRTFGDTARTFEETVYAYGGQSVTLAADAPVVLEDFAGLAVGEIAVEVFDANGRPLADASIQVEDPLRKAWEFVLNSGSTAAYATDGIEEPPIVDLVDGRGTLAHMRSGRVVLRIRDGMRASWLVEADASLAADEPLRIRLPAVGD